MYCQYRGVIGKKKFSKNGNEVDGVRLLYGVFLLGAGHDHQWATFHVGAHDLLDMIYPDCGHGHRMIYLYIGDHDLRIVYLSCVDFRHDHDGNTNLENFGSTIVHLWNDDLVHTDRKVDDDHLPSAGCDWNYYPTDLQWAV